jgi:pimeloyl-ACP methyl ester carboxylesterase
MTTHTTVRGDGVDLAVRSDGPAAAPSMVVGHGVGSTARFVRDAFLAPVTDAGFRLVTYDLRGHGASTPLPDPLDHALDRHVADLEAIVAATGADVVGGVSLGGHVAVAWAADGGAANAAFACLPAWTGRAVPGEGPHAVVARAVADVGIAGLRRRVAEDVEMQPWLRQVLIRDWATHDPGSLAAALTALDGGLGPTEAALRQLAVPLGLVGWRDDPGHPLAVARDWAAWAPRARLETISITDLADTAQPLGTAAIRALDLKR